MKRIILFIFLSTLFGCQKTIFNENIDHTLADEQLIKAGLYFWSNDQKVPLAPDSNLFLVQLDPNTNISKVAKAGGKNVSVLSSSRLLIGKAQLAEENILSKAEKSTIKNKITSFKVNNSAFKPNGKIVFKPKSKNELGKIRKLLGDRVLINDIVDYDVYTADVLNIEKLLVIANELYESNLVEFSHPDFILEITRASNDPYYTNQYYLNQTNNIDINAPEAWALLGPTNSVVKVAVIDDGVEAHEELTGRLLSGYSPKSSTGYGAPIASSAHGQAVAGIVAAKRDNNIGIAGIADFAHIIPINIFYGQETASDIANAINYAWNQGKADIIQNSWSSSGTQIVDVIKNAINNAYTNGRNGKGCVIVFSSGNYHPDGSQALKFNGVAFPANLPNVIAVGAVAKDGNISLYSSRGPEIDFVAPSGQDLAPNVYTIDRMGSNGYSSSNYHTSFSGTSAAAPQVSGVAALLLAKFPNLTAAEVKSLMIQSATDMGPTGFDNTFGYGRINASAALLSGPSVIEGSNFICSDGTYKIFNPGTITLEVASGIATLTALGNNQWKVSRIGQAIGRVRLKSTSTTSTVSYDISVGGPISTDITHGYDGNLEPGSIYSFYVKPGFNLTTYNWSVTGGTIISGKYAEIVQIRTDPNPYQGTNNISINLEYTSECGTGWASASRNVNPSPGGGGGTPIDPGETL